MTDKSSTHETRELSPDERLDQITALLQGQIDALLKHVDQRAPGDRRLMIESTVNRMGLTILRNVLQARLPDLYEKYVAGVREAQGLAEQNGTAEVREELGKLIGE